MRSGSSVNETSGESGVRSRGGQVVDAAERVDELGPPLGALSASAMALIVKSRRARSASMRSENATSGLRVSGRTPRPGGW